MVQVRVVPIGTLLSFATQVFSRGSNAKDAFLSGLQSDGKTSESSMPGADEAPCELVVAQCGRVYKGRGVVVRDLVWRASASAAGAKGLQCPPAGAAA